MFSAVSDISVNNVVLLSAPDFNQSLLELLHVIEHKLDHSVLNFGAVVNDHFKPNSLSNISTKIYLNQTVFD